MAANLDFMGVPTRSRKPRTLGLTLVRDQGLSPRQLLDYAETFGEYLDYAKIKQFELWYMKPAVTVEKVGIYKAFGIKPFCGGTVLEAAYLQKLVPQTLESLREMGFTAVEVSDNIIEVDAAGMAKLIRSARESGFEVILEYGKKYPEESLNVDEAVAAINGSLEAGANLVVLERSQLDITIGYDGRGSDGASLEKLVAQVGLDKLVFEAESFDQQCRLIHTFGPDVNLGPNISPDFVIAKLEPARYGLGRDEGYSFFDRLMRPQ